MDYVLIPDEEKVFHVVLNTSDTTSSAKCVKKFVEAVDEAGTWINEEFPKPKLHLFIRSLIKKYEEKPESEKRRVIIPGIHPEQLIPQFTLSWKKIWSFAMCFGCPYVRVIV